MWDTFLKWEPTAGEIRTLSSERRSQNAMPVIRFRCGSKRTINSTHFACGLCLLNCVLKLDSHRRKLRRQTSINFHKLPTIWTHEGRDGRSQRKGEEREERRCRCAKRWEGRKTLYFFQSMCGSRGSKSRPAKAADAEPCGHMRDKKLHAGSCGTTTLERVRCRKSALMCGTKQISKSNAKKVRAKEHFLTLTCRKVN